MSHIEVCDPYPDETMGFCLALRLGYGSIYFHTISRESGKDV